MLQEDTSSSEVYITMNDNFTFVTVATQNLLPEIKLWSKSIELFTGAHQLVVGDIDPKDLPPGVDVLPFDKPFKWEEVGFRKCYSIRKALEKYETAMFCDADILFMSPWEPVIDNQVIIMSPHFCCDHTHKTYGYFNSGYLGISRKNSDFLDWWDAQPQFTETSFGDQQCFDNWPVTRMGFFSEPHNVGWWRLSCRAPDSLFGVSTNDGWLYYNGDRLISIHSHVITMPGFSSTNLDKAVEFNRIIFAAMVEADNENYNELFRLMETKNVILSSMVGRVAKPIHVPASPAQPVPVPPQSQIHMPQHIQSLPHMRGRTYGKPFRFTPRHFKINHG